MKRRVVVGVGLFSLLILSLGLNVRVMIRDRSTPWEATAAAEEPTLVAAAPSLRTEPDPFEEPQAGVGPLEEAEPPVDVIRRSPPRRISENWQERYVELVAKAARRMSHEQLKQAVTELSDELGKQDAAAEAELRTAVGGLSEAVENLRKVADEHQGTPSAERARALSRDLRQLIKASQLAPAEVAP